MASEGATTATQSLEQASSTLKQESEPTRLVGGHLRLLDSVAAADFLGLSKKTLEAYRLRGGGPAYYKVGRVRYSEADLIAWLESRRRTSTSDTGAC